ncbi:MAG TPA: ABC transporter ATP-binding protein [Caulobacteraceae bacterium]|jgi:subfamily B ATP-binding cassette protein MsbA|nr:ABC transporter ATP-binding protein [Caulobacteraceae bacterium]
MTAALPGLETRDVAARLARRYLAPRWMALGVSLLCAAVFAILSGVLLGILQPAVDDLIVHPKPGALATLPLIIVVLAIGRGLAQVVQALLINKIGNGIVGDVQVELFARLVRADLARLRASHSGGFVSSVLYDAGLIREAATTGVINLFQQGLTLLAAAVVMARADWRLGLFVLLAAPIATLLMRRFMRRATRAASGAMAATSNLSTAIMEGLDGVRVVKMENREAYEEARVAAVVAERQRHIISGDNARAAAAPASETLMMLVVAAVLAYEGWRASAGHPDVGAFTAFFAALLTAAQALRQVSNLGTVISQGLVAGRRLFAALDVEPEVRDTPGAPALAAGEGTLRLEAVSFSYDGEAPVLDGVDLEVRRGEIVALVGPSGAGKTTVLNLIPRFYDVTAGAVTIDGQDVRAVTLASLRGQIALVTQEPFLFDDTVAANIAYAREGARRDQIEAAAAQAAAHEFILALPDGYDTVVGEAGARLSGGQRQRIAIARAFLKDAPILLLDEATSALDTASEAQIQAALARLMSGRTTLLIAHRLSTVRGAERIYVLDRGAVVETGAHAALIDRGGLYARLARTQDLELAPGTAA